MPKSKTTAAPKVSVPGAGVLSGFPALSSPSAPCSAAYNLLTQVAPLLALVHCQSKVLNLLKPLVEVINGLPNPPVQARQGFAKAAAELLPCLAATAPASQLPLARDLICLEIRNLNCFLENLKNAQSRPAAVPGVLSSYPPIVGILDLAGEVLRTAGLQVPQAPALSGKTDKTSLGADAKAVQSFVANLQSVADALGGC